MAAPKRYSPEQITRILKQQEAGMKVAEICSQPLYSKCFMFLLHWIADNLARRRKSQRPFLTSGGHLTSKSTMMLEALEISGTHYAQEEETCKLSEDIRPPLFTSAWDHLLAGLLKMVETITRPRKPKHTSASLDFQLLSSGCGHPGTDRF